MQKHCWKTGALSRKNGISTVCEIRDVALGSGCVWLKKNEPTEGESVGIFRLTRRKAWLLFLPGEDFF
jgi:hypothetical protein